MGSQLRAKDEPHVMPPTSQRSCCLLAAYYFLWSIFEAGGSQQIQNWRPGAAERVYFRSITRQRHVFRIAFPTQHPDGTPVIAPGAREVLLRFTGAHGKVDLRWELDPDAPIEESFDYFYEAALRGDAETLDKHEIGHR